MLQMLALVFAGGGFMEGVAGTFIGMRSEAPPGIGPFLQVSGVGMFLAGVVFYVAPFNYTMTMIAGFVVAGICSTFGALRLVRTLNAAKGSQPQ